MKWTGVNEEKKPHTHTLRDPFLNSVMWIMESKKDSNADVIVELPISDTFSKI